MWIEELKKKDWTKVEKEESLENQTELYTKLVTEALDVCAHSRLSPSSLTISLV